MDFPAVAFERMKESQTLFENDYHHGAIYLIGYALEIKLKELLQKKKGRYKQIHNLQELFHDCGFNYRFYRSDPWEGKFIDIWHVEMRYRVNDLAGMPPEEIGQIYRAAGRLIGRINKRMV